jgi:hypothetical protein
MRSLKALFGLYASALVVVTLLSGPEIGSILGAIAAHVI